MSDASSICFVTEGDDQIGFGHLFRTGVLGRAFQKAGYEVAIYARSAEARDFLSRHNLVPGIKIVDDIDGRESADWQAWDVRDPVPVGEVALAKEAGRHTLLIDDLGAARTIASVVVDALMVPERAEALPHSEQTCYLYGLEYYALDQKCFAARGLRNPATPGVPLIAFGGSDPAGLVVPFLKALEHAGLKSPVTVVAGEGHPEMNVIRELGHRMQADVVEFVDDLEERIARASVVITKLGLTTIEAFAIGTPVVLIEPYPFHEEVSASLAHHYEDWPAAAFGLGCEKSFKSAAEYVVKEKFAAHAAQEPYCDGQGAARIVNYLGTFN